MHDWLRGITSAQRHDKSKSSVPETNWDANELLVHPAHHARSRKGCAHLQHLMARPVQQKKRFRQLLQSSKLRTKKKEKAIISILRNFCNAMCQVLPTIWCKDFDSVSSGPPRSPAISRLIWSLPSNTSCNEKNWSSVWSAIFREHLEIILWTYVLRIPAVGHQLVSGPTVRAWNNPETVMKRKQITKTMEYSMRACHP